MNAEVPKRSGDKVAFVPIEKESTGACDNYSVDMSAASFGACTCGFSKPEHDVGPAFVPRMANASDTAHLKVGILLDKEIKQAEENLTELKLAVEEAAVDEAKLREAVEREASDLILGENAGAGADTSGPAAATVSSVNQLPSSAVANTSNAAADAISNTGLRVIVFKSEKLGINLRRGASIGHLPVLENAVEAEATPCDGGDRIGDGEATAQSLLSLYAGDELVEVQGVSISGASDPFSEALSLLRSHRQRPITLGFLVTTAGPYTVTFPDASLGIALEPNAWDSASFPVVWNNQKCPQPFPRVGDALVAVNGDRLTSPSNKLAEATQLIRKSSRPLSLLFQPPAASAASKKGPKEKLSTIAVDDTTSFNSAESVVAEHMVHTCGAGLSFPCVPSATDGNTCGVS